MRELINILIDDYRFNYDEIESELYKVKRFYQNFGVDLSILKRLREPLFGVNMHFSEPNGSHANLIQRKAVVTYNDWMNYYYDRAGIIIHELGHAIFKLPDHYENETYYEYTVEPCIMNNVSEFTLCPNCINKIDNHVIQKRNIRTIGFIGGAFLIGLILVKK